MDSMSYSSDLINIKTPKKKQLKRIVRNVITATYFKSYFFSTVSNNLNIRLYSSVQLLGSTKP